MLLNRNKILAELAPDTMRRLHSKVGVVPINSREILCERNQPGRFVYFPTSGLISPVVGFSDGFQAEVGLVGADGMVGLSSLNGVQTELADAVVQVPGEALRMKADDFRQMVLNSPELDAILRRYMDSMWEQATQIAACNGHHSLERRLARWLLMVDDRAGRKELRITQEELATVLCVHRPSVTIAAGRLQRSGAIRYSGGSVTIEDRSELERSSCECYRALQQRALQRKRSHD